MKHDIISIILIGGLAYLVNLKDAKATNVKHYVTIGNIFKCLIGYSFFKQNTFSTKNVIAQIGNILSIIIAIVLLVLGSKNVIQIFIALETLNIFIEFIVSIFVNKY